MFEAVRAHPDGDGTVARFARTADRLGYDGLVVRNARSTTYDSDAVADRWGIDVVDAVEVDAESPSSASGHVGNYRPDYTVVCVRGGSDRTNRFAVESDQVDVLTTPTAGDGSFDHVLANAAREHGVRVEFDLGPVLQSAGGRRVRILQKLRRLREIVLECDAPYVVSARPDSHLALRTPRELAALGETIGFERERILEGLREWGRLAERNRHRQSESFIEPGVERGKYEEDDR
jgi:ribonuclease P/MRP protein subunit RPP1